MRQALFYLPMALLLVTGGMARAQDTLAVSREATLYFLSPSPATLALSREATLYLTPQSAAATRAVSREATIFLPPGVLPPTLAVSREVTLYKNYATRNAASVLRIAAGLTTPTPLEMQFYNLVTSGASATVVDIMDAAAVAQLAAHPERVP